ncbi:MAG: hypothetical protein JST14_11480 [Bacteroidetes bacterium]|nr:hypothetical protein [Bacteroidota bacterium]
MKTMKMKLLFALGLLAVAATVASAQCKEIKWPEDRKKADECVAIYGDAMKQGNYRAATGCIQWMINNAPQWQTKLYIDAADAYDKLADKESDPAKKKVLVDSLLLIYDLRIKSCGDEANVLNRKAFASFKYNQKSKERLPELLALYDKVFEIGGNNITDGNLVAYMTVVKNNQTLFKNISEDDILSRYDKTIAVCEAKISKANSANPVKADEVKRLKEIKDACDGILVGLVKFDCEMVRTKLGPKFHQNPKDLTLAKKIFTFMLQDKCADDPLALEAAEAIHTLNPEKDFGLLKFLTARNIAAGNYEKAETLMKEGLPLATTPEQKADANLLLGSIEAKKGNFVGARTHFMQAGTSEAYEKIGDLYYNSFDNCAKRQNVAEDRLVYIAAWEMYQKAGNAQLMARAKAQFPSKEEIFLLNWTAGSTQHIGCWISESVALKTRD